MNKRSKRIFPSVLLVTSTFDYSADFIAYRLKSRNIDFLRLNRDQFDQLEIILEPKLSKLTVAYKQFLFELNRKSLKSIYFRAPIFLRDNYQPGLKINAQLKRNQWASFLRSLVIFDDALWVNHPKDTFLAEIKPYQLLVANRIGFDVPETLIANVYDSKYGLINKSKKIVIKSLEPALLKTMSKEAFIYSSSVNEKEVLNSEFKSFPMILQRDLNPKTDVRTTVVGNKVTCHKITAFGKSVRGDWRLNKKENLHYVEVSVPKTIKEKCQKLMKALNLKFGAIDFAISGKKWFFLEINPTGEWGWLVDQTHRNGIDNQLTALLISGLRRK